MTRLLPAPGAGAVLCCEHASNLLPSWLRPEPADLPWLSTHWAWDPGAAGVATGVAARLGAPAVLARWSRLACDVNRAEDQPDLAREDVADDHTGAPALLGFNRALTAEARAERIRLLHRPYHGSLQATLASAARAGPAALVSVHSFTRDLGGERRTLDAGVLFDDHPDPAHRLVRALTRAGLRTAPNEPYDGFGPTLYSARRHGRHQGVPYLIVELCNDLLRTRAQRDRLARVLSGALLEAGLARALPSPRVHALLG